MSGPARVPSECRRGMVAPCGVWTIFSCLPKSGVICAPWHKQCVSRRFKKYECPKEGDRCDMSMFPNEKPPRERRLRFDWPCDLPPGGVEDRLAGLDECACFGDEGQ